MLTVLLTRRIGRQFEILSESGVPSEEEQHVTEKQYTNLSSGINQFWLVP